MSDKWDSRFMALAAHIARWSKDPSTKVGCVLVNQDRIIVGTGYNGFPRGVADTADRLEDREQKYLYVQHAEANAVLNSSTDVKGSTAYVTHPPCAGCMGVLVQSGISRIVTVSPDPALAERFKLSFEVSANMAHEAGIVVDWVSHV